MYCYVYKGDRKEDHFVYLKEELDLNAPEQSLPDAIVTLMGEFSLVLEFDLTSDRKLPQADAAQILTDMDAQGFYLQIPKKDMRAEEDRLFS